MHDIWNPWHGCIKKSEGCEHCYMYYLDHLRNMDGEDIFLTNNLNYPLSKNLITLVKHNLLNIR